MASYIPEFLIHAPALMEWARFGSKIAQATKPALARALNAFGNNLLDGTVDRLADKTGLSPEEIKSRIIVSEASPSQLSWSMDATAIAPRDATEWERVWDTPERGDEFDTEQLLNIIGHEDCCEKCEEAISKNPYTQEQINNLAAEWAFWEPPTPVVGERSNLLHPNCRCGTQPWRGYRRVEVSQEGGKGKAISGMITPVHLGKLLGETFGTELKTLIRTSLKKSK